MGGRIFTQQRLKGNDMKVWVLTGHYDSVPCTHVLGVFANSELAIQRRYEIDSGVNRYDSYSIEPFELITE